MKNDLIYSERELKEVILPLAKKITRLYNEKKTVFVGIQGGQGTGKTTLVHFLKAHLQATGYKVKSFSIDDFYTSSFHRQRLANTLIDNPFYQIRRGMPGTHRVKVLNNVLKKAKQGKSFIIPIFDKSLNRAWGDLSKKKLKQKVNKISFFLKVGV